MKITTLVMLIASFFILWPKAYGQSVMGEAILFNYDAAGNRVLREYKLSTEINLKQGQTDTTIERFFDNSTTLKIYPNPVTSFVTIENLSWQLNDAAIAKLYDITGKLIVSQQLTSAKSEVSFQGLSIGAYQLHYFLNSRFVSVWKVIKQ